MQALSSDEEKLQRLEELLEEAIQVYGPLETISFRRQWTNTHYMESYETSIELSRAEDVKDRPLNEQITFLLEEIQQRLTDSGTPLPSDDKLTRMSEIVWIGRDLTKTDGTQEALNKVLMRELYVYLPERVKQLGYEVVELNKAFYDGTHKVSITPYEELNPERKNKVRYHLTAIFNEQVQNLRNNGGKIFFLGFRPEIYLKNAELGNNAVTEVSEAADYAMNFLTNGVSADKIISTIKIPWRFKGKEEARQYVAGKLEQAGFFNPLITEEGTEHYVYKSRIDEAKSAAEGFLKEYIDSIRKPLRLRETEQVGTQEVDIIQPQKETKPSGLSQLLKGFKLPSSPFKKPFYSDSSQVSEEEQSALSELYDVHGSGNYEEALRLINQGQYKGVESKVIAASSSLRLAMKNPLSRNNQSRVWQAFTHALSKYQLLGSDITPKMRNSVGLIREDFSLMYGFISGTNIHSRYTTRFRTGVNDFRNTYTNLLPKH